MKIKCIAIDDEPMALEKIKNYINDIPYLELLAVCRGVHEAKAVLEEADVDAMFIDISMPDMSGMDFVKSLDNPPYVIFTTAYSEYAVESYEVQALDYLLKPYDKEGFQRVADNLYKAYANNASHKVESEFAYFKTGTTIRRANFDEIKYIEGMNEYLKIHPVDGDSYLTYATFKSLINVLPDNFLQVHRSYVVNMKHVLEIEKSLLKLKGGTTIPIGGLYKESFMKYVKKFLVQK